MFSCVYLFLNRIMPKIASKYPVEYLDLVALEISHQSIGVIYEVSVDSICYVSKIQMYHFL